MNNKKRLILILLIFISVIFASLFWYFDLRYQTKLPMPDLEYKKTVVKDSKNFFYTVENLRPLVGEDEMIDFIKSNDKDPKVYMAGKDFRANFHMHTLNSDGSMSVKELLDKAQEYGQTLPANEFMYVAVTDHNTVNGAKDVIKVLETNPNKYNKVKVVAGIEVNTAFNNSKYAPKPVDIHVLTWCINPYDKFLNKEFFKKDKNDKINRKKTDRDFDSLISMMKNYGIPGVAHPARYTIYMGDKKYDYIKEMFSRYVIAGKSKKTVFTEGYYQSYPDCAETKDLGPEFQNYLKFINKEAEKLGIIKTGSFDTHGTSIFRK